jgi:hypothetical protein
MTAPLASGPTERRGARPQTRPRIAPVERVHQPRTRRELRAAGIPRLRIGRTACAPPRVALLEPDARPRDFAAAPFRFPLDGDLCCPGIRPIEDQVSANSLGAIGAHASRKKENAGQARAHHEKLAHIKSCTAMGARASKMLPKPDQSRHIHVDKRSGGPEAGYASEA